VTGEQVTIREWVERRDKAMAAEFKAHRAETKLDIANLAKEVGKEMRDEIRAARDEASSGRRWMFGVLTGLGVAVVGVLAANAYGLVTVFLRLGQLPGAG